MGQEYEEMLKIAGVILCVAGSAGYGVLKIAGWNRAIKELEQWILLFEKMKNSVYYRRDIVADIFSKMDEEIYGIGGKYVADIGAVLREDRTKDLMQVWREQMLEWERLTSLPMRVKKTIMSFPGYVGEADCEQQINHLEFYIQRLRVEKENIEKEISSKKKPVMAISLVGGLTVSILLL